MVANSAATAAAKTPTHHPRIGSKPKAGIRQQCGSFTFAWQGEIGERRQLAR